MPAVLLAYNGDGAAFSQFVMDFLAQEKRVLVDSGAFSAWRTGQPRSLPKYIETCKALSPSGLVDGIASLDVIGDWKATMSNHLKMLDAGLDTMPTFHVGEPDQALDAILAIKPRYIGLGGLVGKSANARRAWLDVVWAKLVRHPHWQFKVHGWGVTDFTLVTRYPWFSVDSSSAISSANRGSNGSAHRIETDTTQAGKHALVRVRQHIDRIEETIRFATEKWAKQGIVWEP